MELEDLKNTWKGMNDGTIQDIDSKLIDKMTTTKYHSNMNKVTYAEICGVIICLAGIAYIGANFSKLDTSFLKTTAIISILLLLTLSAISLISVWQLKMSGDVRKPYAQTLKVFAAKKIRFLKFQKLNATLSYLLLVTIIILLPKFFGGKDISDNKYFWGISFSFGYIFLLFYSRWVSKHYKDILHDSEELLKEIGS